MSLTTELNAEQTLKALRLVTEIEAVAHEMGHKLRLLRLPTPNTEAKEHTIEDVDDNYSELMSAVRELQERWTDWQA